MAFKVLTDAQAAHFVEATGQAGAGCRAIGLPHYGQARAVLYGVPPRARAHAGGAEGAFGRA